MKSEVSRYLAILGHKGGTARAKTLTAKQRHEIAVKGGKARQEKAKEQKKGGNK